MLLDERRIDDYAALFTTDGEWVGNMGRAAGREQIVTLMRAGLDVTTDESQGSYHFVFNPHIDVSGDTASARSGFAFVARDPEDQPDVRMIGHYEDLLARTSEGWRFTRRQAFLDIPWKRTPRW